MTCFYKSDILTDICYAYNLTNESSDIELMNKLIKSRLNKKDVFTIPNVLSFFRILLIPVIVVLYCYYKLYVASTAVIIFSGITDVIDGKIARKYNMISDFGKFIDPVADKLTQAAMLFCLVIRYKWVIALIVLMVIKEATLFIGGCFVLKKTDTINSAKWYGKLSTFIMYAVMTLLFLVNDIKPVIANVGIAICAFALVGSTLLYLQFYYSILKKNTK